MGKDITYINAAGKEVGEAEFKKSGGCKATWDPRPRTWNALIICAPTKEMLETAGNLLAKKSVDRLEHHIPCEKGSEVGIDDTDPHEFTVKFPSCAISEAHQVSIVKAWATWAENLTKTDDGEKDDSKKADDGKKDDSKKSPDDSKADDSKKSPDDSKADDSKKDDSKKADDGKPARKKHIWDMSDKEREAYVDERIDYYAAREMPKK